MMILLATESDTKDKDTVINHLVTLGMTTYEAKVFSALTRLGDARVGEIHEVAEVPRSAIYETLQRLEHRGLIETSTGRPKKFRAVPPKIAIAKMESELMTAVKDARDGLEELAGSPHRGASDVRIWAVKGRTRIRERIESIMDSVRTELFVAGYPELLLSLDDLWKRAKTKRIKVRFATADPSKIARLKEYGEILRPMFKKNGPKMRLPKVLFVRADKRVILLASEYRDEKQIEDMTAFWTDDESIVGFINYLMGSLSPRDEQRDRRTRQPKLR